MRLFPVKLSVFAALLCCVLVAVAGCNRHDHTHSFALSLRCGMTPAEVTRLAHDRGYDASDQSWLQRRSGQQRTKSKDLSLVDLSFRAGRLVGYREGTYSARTRRVEYRDVDLCR